MSIDDQLLFDSPESASPLVAQCQAWLRDKRNIEAHWVGWGTWLLSDQDYGLTRWPMPDVVEEFICNYALPYLQGRPAGEDFRSARSAAYTMQHNATSYMPPTTTAAGAADRTSTGAGWGAMWRAALWAGQHGVNLWPYVRARLGLDMDEAAHHPFLAEILQSPHDLVPALVYADWLDERGADGNSWRILATAKIEAFPRQGTLAARIQQREDAYQSRRSELRFWENVDADLRSGYTNLLEAHAAEFREHLREFSQRSQTWNRVVVQPELRIKIAEAVGHRDEISLQSLRKRYHNQPEAIDVIAGLLHKFSALDESLTALGHADSQLEDLARRCRCVAVVAPELRDKLLQAIWTQEGPTYHDPIEVDPRYRPLIAAAQKEASAEIDDPSGVFSFDQVWAVQQRILREKYGIDWATPAELNRQR